MYGTACPNSSFLNLAIGHAHAQPSAAKLVEHLLWFDASVAKPVVNAVTGLDATTLMAVACDSFAARSLLDPLLFATSNDGTL
jgi:hypothetical protein